MDVNTLKHSKNANDTDLNAMIRQLSNMTDLSLRKLAIRTFVNAQTDCVTEAARLTVSILKSIQALEVQSDRDLIKEETAQLARRDSKIDMDDVEPAPPITQQPQFLTYVQALLTKPKGRCLGLITIKRQNTFMPYFT